MATEFVMPKLGLTMEEGTIREWLVEEGQEVAVGDAVLVIETDKVETEVESPNAGVLHRTAAVGDTLGCGTIIGYLLAAGESPPSPSDPTTASSATLTATTADPPALPPTPGAPPGGRIWASPNARRLAAQRGIPLATVRGTGPGGRIVSEDIESAPSQAITTSAPTHPAPTSSPSTTPATAGARLLADLLGVDLRLVTSGAGDGRRQREDVAAYVRRQLATLAELEAAPTAAPRGVSAPLLQVPTSVVPLSGMRGAIATRMQQSLAAMAQLTLHLDASMDAVVADRAARKATGAAPGYTDYLIAAVARALREHPRLNAQVTDDGIAELPDVHVGMAVALDDGLLVPVIHHADRLALDALSAETTRLAEAARTRKLSLADLEGGTFSVSSLGGYGVDGFTPVINPPNVAILGVGRLRDQLSLVGGDVRSASTITLSLTWDHRVLDGAPAAGFARRIAQLLADPEALDRPS